MSRWAEVWERRTIDPSVDSLLARLMAADGLDTGFGSVTEQAWRDAVSTVMARLGLRPGERVFEVGCGAGAFLFPLYERGVQVGGLDRSPTLVGFAHEAMPSGRFEVAEATAHGDETWDFVVSSGVFLYFPDLDYAWKVVEAMVRRARRGVAILDVPDLARRDEALAMRRAHLGEAAYTERYRGLDHLYLERRWLADALTSAGCGAVEVEDQQLHGYANGAHRFNAFGWRQARPAGEHTR